MAQRKGGRRKEGGGRAQASGRSGRQNGKTTVVSCRVFRKGVCKKTAKNIILVNKSISNSAKCQQFCYATPGCAAFTHFDQSKSEDRKCVLFRDCNGRLSDCKNCISGPIMPRITECLAQRQEVAPEAVEEVSSGGKKPCSSGHCTGLCIGPRCPELLGSLGGLGNGNLGRVGGTEGSAEPSSSATADADAGADAGADADARAADEQGVEGIDEVAQTDTVIDDYSDYSDDYADDYLDDYSSDSNSDAEDVAVDEEALDYDVATDYGIDARVGDEVPAEEPGIDYDFEYTEEENIQVDDPFDLPLDEEAVNEEEEEEEEVDINIDEGFLEDNAGNAVDLPVVETRGNVQNAPAGHGGNTFIFFFCALGGTNDQGAVNVVDLLNTGLGNAAQSLTIAPLPAQALRGGSTSSAYTNGAITTCSQGFTVLSPYGFIYKPGSCYDYSLTANSWEDTGARLTSFRRGATITKLGRYLMATGGLRQKRALNTVEVFDPKRPKAGWKKLSKLKMPAAVAEHCAVTLKGRRGKEVIVTGGKGRENRVMKLDVKTQKWYSLNRLTTGRRKHACVKANINGRPGLVVSGGAGPKGGNMTSVEFYDAKTGAWLTLPSLQKGRRGHAMTVTKGKLVVAGGEGVARGGRQYLDDVEIFTGKRWVTSKQKLDRPRADFSLLKIPQKRSRRSSPKRSRERKPSSPKRLRGSRNSRG